MNIESHFGLIRSLTAFGGLGVLLVLEAWQPFRAPVQAKLAHVAVNLGVAGTNAVAVNVVFGSLLLVWASRVTEIGWGLFPALGLGAGPTIGASVVALDVIFYGVHWANHRVPVLWRFHRAHHSDLDFDVSTALRFHLGEVLVSTGVKAVCIAVLGVSPWGLVAFEMMLLTAAQFQHSNLRLPEPWETSLRALIVTPNMHRVHHSRIPTEHNANFGTIFSGWDRLIGTYRMAVRQEHIVIGLAEYPRPENVGFLRFWSMPLGRGCRR